MVVVVEGWGAVEEGCDEREEEVRAKGAAAASYYTCDLTYL